MAEIQQDLENPREAVMEGKKRNEAFFSVIAMRRKPKKQSPQRYHFQEIASLAFAMTIEIKGYSLS
ncbi:MAG: hypothetical protein AABZ60_00420 [Planctomycetota bacterium]